jgi:hypothetical protein
MSNLEWRGVVVVGWCDIALQPNPLSTHRTLIPRSFAIVMWEVWTRGTPFDEYDTVWAVRDAMGARNPASREAALARLARAGAEIVTTEMVAFEWAEDAADPRWRALLALVK